MNRDRLGGRRRTDRRGRPTIYVVVGVDRSLSLKFRVGVLLIAGGGG